MVELTTLTFKEETITIQMRKIESESPDRYEIVQQERTAQVAYIDDKPTGLAYYTYIDEDEPVYSLTHVPTGCTVLGAGYNPNPYDMGSEESLRRWIELLLEFADWTGEKPVITSLGKALKYAAVGAREEA